MGTKENEWRVFGIAALLTISAFLFMLIGCGAPGQLEPELAPRAIRDAEKCARNYESCFFVHVTNDQYYRAVITLNGLKIGEVEGYSHDSLPVPYARLQKGLCAQVRVRLIGPSADGQTDQQCLRSGGYFTFQIDNQGHLWLTPWGGR